MLLLARLSFLLLLSGLLACGGQAIAPTQAQAEAEEAAISEAEAEAEAEKEKKEKSGQEDPLFPGEKTGWKTIDATTRDAVDAFAKDYLGFIDGNRTERTSARSLLAMAREAGAQPFEEATQAQTGQLFTWQDQARASLLLLKIGTAPIDEGLRVIVASLDAGVIRLTPNPVYDKSGLALFDTSILGSLKLESWLNTPLALALYIAPKKPGSKPRQLTIGDDPSEPVFTIPDLLPHLSRRVQRGKLIDTPERLDAVAGVTSAAIRKMLKSYGLRASDLSRAEAVLVPAGAASFVGVDRALIAGANHRARALPFAATRAIIEGQPKHSTVVILMGHDARSYAGAGPEAHVANLLPRVVEKLAGRADALDLRRIMARSAVLLFGNHRGDRNRGLVLNNRRDDAMPAALRRVLQVFSAGEVQVQLAQTSGWSQAREVASLDIDTVELGLPIAGVGTPYELLSTLDLYQALRACEAWVNQ